MMLSSLLFLHAWRSHGLLLALDHFPALELRQRPTLFDSDDVTHAVFIGFVVGVILLRPPHRLLEHWMGITALDTDDDGLVLLVAHHNALERALRHLEPLTLSFSSALRACVWLPASPAALAPAAAHRSAFAPRWS